MPAGLDPVEAASLRCAGLTTFNALRHSGARPGDVVAVLGLAGLGHLAVQHASRMGFHTIGIARGRDKRLEQRVAVGVRYLKPIPSYRRFRVAPTSIKQKVLEAVQQLPPDATVEDAMERLYFLAKVERGVAQADAGETLSHEAARKRLLK